MLLSSPDPPSVPRAFSFAAPPPPKCVSAGEYCKGAGNSFEMRKTDVTERRAGTVRCQWAAGEARRCLATADAGNLRNMLDAGS